MVLLLHHGELRMALHSAAAACSLCPIPECRGRTRRSFAMSIPATFRPIRASFRASLSSSSNSSSQTPSSLPSALPTITSNETSAAALTGDKKPAVCTADELHYVAVPGTEWRLALWRYTPCPKAPPRNHPLVLLSGVGTNAIGFDLSPGASFARHMSSQGFDTWIVEVRGAGLSKRVKSKVIEKLQNGSVTSDLVGSIDKSKVSEQLQNGSVINKEYKSSALSKSQQPIVNGSLSLGTSNGKTNQIEALKSSDEPQLVTMLTDTLMRLTERLSGYLSEGQLKAVSDNFFNRISELLEEADLSERFNEIQGKILALLEARQNSIASSQIRELSQRLINIIDEGQRSVSPQLFDLQERFATTIEDFQKQIDLIITYDWDFDHYLEEDIPAAMEYIKNHTQPKDGKLLAVGHSMGGILLYAMLSRCGFEGRESGLAAVVTLASSVDYTSSNSSLKLLLPLADPAEVLNVPVIPLGALLAAAHPLSSRPPYVLSWLNSQISAQDMMHPELLEKLVLNNFCTIPAKLLLHLTTAFRDGGLRDRSGKFFYKDHLHKCTVPVLALGGDQDLICPPEAVYETVKLIPQHMVTYKLLGKPDGPHYGHYDLVGCRLANSEAYPCIVEFLSRHDSDSYCGSIN